MDKFITGKTLEDALEAACIELNLKREEFTYEIIDYPNKGFLGIGAKHAKIKVIYQISPQEYIKQYIKGLFDIFKINNYEMKIDFAEDKHINIQIDGEDASVLTNKQSDAVESLQLLLAMTINKLCNEHYKISLNVNDFREKSILRIEALSVKTANLVLKTHKRIVLNPMSAYQRRIVHAKLQDFNNITTYSVGEEPNRKVIVAYQGPGGYQKSYQKPINRTNTTTVNGNTNTNLNNTKADELPFTNTNTSASANGPKPYTQRQNSPRPYQANSNYQKSGNSKPYTQRPYNPRPNTNTVNKETNNPVKKEDSEKKPE
ncbi:MAG: RNA-binding protein Jag [Clostridia bacterium]|nr:RNA-binding protein Jag [Clostridia bacterium]